MAVQSPWRSGEGRGRTDCHGHERFDGATLRSRVMCPVFLSSCRCDRRCRARAVASRGDLRRRRGSDFRHDPPYGRCRSELRADRGQGRPYRRKRHVFARPLRRAGIDVRSGHLVHAPSMERRAYATAAQQWPEVDWSVSSRRFPFVEDIDGVNETNFVHGLVGDTFRVLSYPAKASRSSNKCLSLYEKRCAS